MNFSFQPALAGAVWLMLAASCVSTEHEASVPVRASSSIAPPVPAASVPAGPSRTEYTPPSGQGRRVTSATILNTVRTTHVFSSAQEPDNFVLQLRGPRVLTGQLYFSVVDAQGDTLRRETLPARVLKDPQAVTVRDQEISVLRGMNTFFSAAHFSAPAEAGSARATSGTSAVAFSYPTASGPRRLVYSPQQGRAVVLAE